MNWIQIQGNFIETTPNTLRYVPLNDLTEFTHEKKGLNSFTSHIKSSEYFESGTISFKLNIKSEQDAYFSVNLGNDKLYIGLNSGFSTKAFSVRVNENDNSGLVIYSQAIDKGSLLLNHDYDFKIHLNGSNIKVLLDSVLVCDARVPIITKSQIKLSFRSRGEIVLKDLKINSLKPKAFVVMQFTEEYNQLYSQVIKPVCESYNYDCLRGDEYFTTGSILKDITDAINESSIVIADITPNNPNVFYEVGYSHALNKPTILLSDKKRDKLPFDVSGFRTLFYDNTIAGKSEVEERLKKHLENIQSN